MNTSGLAGAVEQRVALVLDDDPIAVLMLSAHLWSLSYQAVAITSSERLLESMREHRPSLVVLDVRMPGVSGEDAARQIRHAPLARQPHIVLHSSLPATELALIAASCGANGWAVKNAGFRELMEVVRQLDQP